MAPLQQARVGRLGAPGSRGSGQHHPADQPEQQREPEHAGQPVPQFGAEDE
jgi:hypothetical protein